MKYEVGDIVVINAGYYIGRMATIDRIWHSRETMAVYDVRIKTDRNFIRLPFNGWNLRLPTKLEQALF